MAKYLYIFAYQTPEQRHAVAAHGPAEESSAAVFIEADSAEEALAWGREISEAFLRHLLHDPVVSWKGLNFAHWVENDPRQEYPADILARLPVVPRGSFPDFALFQH